MKNILPILFVCLMAFSFACHHPVQYELVPTGSHLMADTVCEFPYYIEGIAFIKNNYLFMIDKYNAGRIRFYNTRTGKMDSIQAGIIIDRKTGQPKYFSMNDSTKYPDVFLQQLPLSFYQYDMRSYYTYTFENNKVKLSRQSFKYKRINRAEPISENKYLSTGHYNTGLFGLYDKGTKLMDYYGHYPQSVADPFDQNWRERELQTPQENFAFSDTHSKVVYASDKFAYLSCYHYTGSKLKFRWEKYIVLQSATKAVNANSESDKSVARGRFSDVAVAGDYIYAGYSQINIPDTTHSILVYDMRGNHVTTYHIDSPISSIIVDAEGGALYGISRKVEWEPVIVRFRFDKI